MPGLFDNNNSPPDIVGGILRGIGGALNPEVYRQNVLEQAYRQTGLPPGIARAGAVDPQALNSLWQQKIFHDTYGAVKQQFPDMSDAEILTRMTSPGGMEGLFVPKPFGEFKTPSGASGPGTLLGSSVTPPPGLGFPAAGAGPQALPTQQPAAIRPQPQGPAPLSPMDQAGVNYRGAVAESEAKGKAAGGLQPGFPQALVKAHQTISALEAIRDDPRLESISGRIAGGLPARYSSAPDLVNSIDSANNMLLNDTLTSARNISGRAINAGTLKEIRPYDLNADRLGGADSLRADINRAIKTIQDETEAAWVGSNSPQEYKPVWGQSNAPQANQPSDRHIQFLRAHPDTADQFDAKFGKGASQKVLGNAQRL